LYKSVKGTEHFGTIQCCYSRRRSLSAPAI